MASKIEDHGPGSTHRLTGLIPNRQLPDCLQLELFKRFIYEQLPYLQHKLEHLESFCGFLPIWKGGKNPMVTAYRDEPHLSLKQALAFNPAALAIRSKNLLCFDYDDEKALDFVVSRGIDFTFETLHIRRTDKLWRFKTVYLVSDEQLLQIPNGRIDRTINYQNQKLDIFLSNNSYIIFLGEHEDKEGYYFPPDGLGIDELAPPPKDIWDLVLEIASRQKPAPKKRSSNSCNGDWIAARPCPICNRDKDDDCRTNKAGDVLLCHRGNTFHPPTLDVGEIIAGTQWAYCGLGEDCTGSFSTFKIHRQVTRSNRPSRRYRRVKNAK